MRSYELTVWNEKCTDPTRLNNNNNATYVFNFSSTTYLLAIARTGKKIDLRLARRIGDDKKKTLFIWEDSRIEAGMRYGS